MEIEKKDICVIISGSTGGIGKELSKLCISSDEIAKCILLFKDEEKIPRVYLVISTVHELRSISIIWKVIFKAIYFLIEIS